MSFDKSTQIFYAGSWREVSSGQSFEVFNPANGEVCSRVADASQDDVKHAIAAAFEAKEHWAALSHTRRAAYLLKAADIMEERQQESRRWFWH